MTAPNSAAASKDNKDNMDDEKQGFSLHTHPAVIYSHKRLQDPTQTSQLHTVHVFDFDQTLFQSPAPNAAIWDPYFFSKIMAWDECGPGWWLTRGTLDFSPEVEATGWAGYWNENLVSKVRESAKDPGCLTILLTGRYGPLYSDILLRMFASKQLDFDLVATKPATVYRLPPSSNPSSADSSSNPSSADPSSDLDSDQPNDRGEVYVKLHTFSTKREFLYNVLLEYPGIRKMKVWDDRPGQIAQFRQAGEKWIEQGMLDSEAQGGGGFEITRVELPLKTMEREKEVALVKRMVEVHNRQVDLEDAAFASGGREEVKYLISGEGVMPRIRPELEGVKDMWDPFWEFVPKRRTRIEMAEVVQYTGVMFSPSTQALLERIALGGGRHQEQGQGQGQGQVGELDGWTIQPPAALQDTDLSTWTPSREFYVFLCARKANAEYRQKLGGLGATVFVLVEGVGQVEGRAWALKVRGVHSRWLKEGCKVLAPDGKVFESVSKYLAAHPVKRFGNVTLKKHGSKPYITMAFDQAQGGRASDASRITKWESLHVDLDSSTNAATTFSTNSIATALTGGQKIVLVGTIGEKVVLGSKIPKFGHFATIPRAEIQIPALIKKYATEKKLDITGHELGETLKTIESEMRRVGVANKQSNHDAIFEIVLRVCAGLGSGTDADAGTGAGADAGTGAGANA
ncbi:hypothetical protein KI688_005449 [Linnemannia hyalina]|uniref:Swiss Army Knife RNA repair protein HAD domain-containing protein n=1 Tax=Linnemannia hyalina TaxID=64524 RepID=A0A9P7XMC7_9FUNG|nr:hypothetical protein KI688_005449 [Linnemannia hyalina]